MRPVTLITLLLVLYTVHGRPQDDPDDEMYNDDGLQNDNNYDDYDGNDEKSEYNEPIGSILSKPKTVRVKMGDTAYLPCDAENADDFVTMWRKHNGSLIFQDKVQFVPSTPSKYQRFENRTLVIFNVSHADEGEYSCELAPAPANGTSKVVHNVKIVKGPKIESITIKDSVKTLKVGDQLVLTCKTESGQPEPKIIWSRNGDRLNEGKTIIIQSVTQSDAGDYQCLADNGVATDHKSLKVHVLFPPVVKIEKTTGISGKTYSTELTCSVRAYPEPTVEWKKNGETIVPSAHMQLSKHANKHILVIPDTTFDDFADYSCSAQNSVGEHVFTYKLRGEPSIVRYLGGKRQDGHKNVTLVWEVESESPILEHQIMYKKKGSETWKTITPMLDDPQGSLYKIQHVIINLDSGEYEAKVHSRNQHGWSDFSEPVHFKAAHGQHHKKPAKKAYSDNNVQAQESPKTYPAGIAIGSSSAAESLHYWSTFVSICVVKLCLLFK